MGYLTAKQFSEIWGITERRIIKLCKEERINGAIKNGMVWEIPEETLKPSDRRSKVYEYINMPKKIIVVNVMEEIKEYLLELLYKEGYIVDLKTYHELENDVGCIDKYYEGIVYFAINNMDTREEKVVMEIASRLNSESSIVIVDKNNINRSELEKQRASEFREKIGCRINTLLLDISSKFDSWISYEQIAEDIFNLLLKFKNTTGNTLLTDGGKIEFDKYGRTKDLTAGRFYSAINNCLKKLNKEDYLWCVSIMLEDEWTDSPQEMKFRVTNLDVANRGVNFERIFIFNKARIKQFKNNKTLNIYMKSNIKTLFVDYDEIKEKNPKLLEIVSNGWDGINKDLLIVDVPEYMNKRGYLTKNENQVLESYYCFQELKKYSKELKEVLK